LWYIVKQSYRAVVIKHLLVSCYFEKEVHQTNVYLYELFCMFHLISLTSFMCCCNHF
jgi:hypothetical protein